MSNGITRHEGFEFETMWRPVDSWPFSAAGTIARQVYDFSRAADQGEKIADGNQVDTAPSHLRDANAACSQRVLRSALPRVYFRTTLMLEAVSVFDAASY